MPRGGKFFGAGFAQGLGQSLAQLPTLFLAMQQMDEQAKDREATMEFRKLQNDLLKLKTREFDLSQKQSEAGAKMSERLMNAIAGIPMEGMQGMQGLGEMGGGAPAAEAPDSELAGFAASQGLPASLFPQQQQTAAPAAVPAAGGSLTDRFDIEIGFDPKTRQLFPKTLKPKKPGDMKAESPVGKLLKDRQTFVSEYGEGSEQVKALDEAISASRRKTRTAGAGGGLKPAKLSDVKGLRTEFTTLSSDFVKSRDAFKKIRTAANLESAAGDVSLIFGFMRLQDPASTVREGEFATAQNSAGVPDQVRNLYNRVLTGERLAPEQRKDFLSTSTALFQTAAQSQKMLEQQYGEIAGRSRVNPKDVVVDFFGQELRSGEPPASVEDLPAASSVEPGTVAKNSDTGAEVVSDGTNWIPVRRGKR